MWLNRLFIESPIDFEKRCRNRVWIGVMFLVLGAAALVLSFVARDRVMVMYLEPGYTDYIPGFYHDAYPLYRYPGQRVHQPDRIQDTYDSDGLLRGCAVCVQAAASEGHVGGTLRYGSGEKDK